MDNNLLLDDDILELQGIDEARAEKWDHYLYDGKGVPRVSHILAQCRDSEWLIQWAANIGRRKYDYYRDKALTIGTIVHEIIDEYLKIKYNVPTPGFVYMNKVYEVDYTAIDDAYRESVFNCVENFKVWDRHLEEVGAHIDEIIGFEIPIQCPWYGGTIDWMVRINGAVYICDFKTSKSISPEYLMQAASYMWIVNNGYAPGLPHVDGIGIIRVEKTRRNVLNDLFVNDFIPEQHQMIEAYQRCFAAYLESFYRTINIEYLTKNYNYNPDTIFEKGNK